MSFHTVLPEPGMALQARPWEPAMILDPLARRIHVGDHAREVLIDERLLLPDDGVVYLNWRLARWLAAMTDEAHMLGERSVISGRRRLFDAFAMHVPTACGFIMTVSLRSTGSVRAVDGSALDAAADMHHLPDMSGFKP